MKEGAHTHSRLNPRTKLKRPARGIRRVSSTKLIKIELYTHRDGLKIQMGVSVEGGS